MSRITLDFDGWVSGTCRHAEGLASSYNSKKKGRRSHAQSAGHPARTWLRLNLLLLVFSIIVDSVVASLVLSNVLRGCSNQTDDIMSQIDNFEAMLARGQDSEMLRFTLGSAYLAEGNAEQAAQHLSKAVQMKPDYSAAWKVLGRALAADEHWVAAIEAFDKGLVVAEANGDKQTEKEITVFRKRAQKQLDAQ